MGKTTKSLTKLLLCLAAASTPALGQEGEGERAQNRWRRAGQESQWTFEVNARAEGVDTDGISKDALATTLRTTFSLKTGRIPTGKSPGFGLHLEFEDVTALGNERLFANAGAGSLNNQVSDRPVVADPEITEVLQAYLSHESALGTASLGRFKITHGDQRFLGPVGWRQHHQTFDALRLQTSERKTSWATLRGDIAWIDRTHRITGARLGMDSLAAYPSAQTSPGILALFAYRIDYDAPALASQDTLTLGAHYAPKREVGPWTVFSDLQLAHQRDTAENPTDQSHIFYRVQAGAGRGLWKAYIGQERLGGNETSAFQTPLATLHKFNGWADQFLRTPPQGLADTYLRLDLDWKRTSWTARFHHFEPDAGGGPDFGSETDAQVLWRQSQGNRLGLKYARYSAKSHAQDTTKWMIFYRWSLRHASTSKSVP